MMNKKIRQVVAWTITALVLFTGCGGSSENSDVQPSNPKDTGGLTEFELKHGIGPVNEVVTIREIDMEKVEKGKELFKTKCSACHRIGERYVGPDLGSVLEKRTPAYVMNMILNPDGMVKKHPEARKMLQEFLSPMPNQNLEREEARAIVEYLASAQNEPGN